MSEVRVGARGSPLSRWQAERVRSLLGTAGLSSRFVAITTTGDLDRATPLGRFGKPAVFSAELDEALVDRRIDLAVHSLKDLPTALPEGIRLAAVSAREDPRDALVGRGPLRWSDLPAGATIATSSLRRHAELRRHRPDLAVVELRGNVDTRLAQLDGTGAWTGIVLAVAGLVRLGQGDRIGERLAPELLLPCPGQGALAVTTRAGDAPLIHAIRSAVNDPSAELAVTAERALLHTLEGGCHIPVGALATHSLAGLRLRGRVLSLDGGTMVESESTAPVTTLAAAFDLGREVAEALLERGAERILALARR